MILLLLSSIGSISEPPPEETGVETAVEYEGALLSFDDGGGEKLITILV